MEIRDTEEVNDLTQEYVEKLLRLQLQIAEIQEDIKSIKKDFKMEGVNVTIATRVVNDIKKQLKQKETDRTEEEFLFEKLNNDKINSMIQDILTI